MMKVLDSIFGKPSPRKKDNAGDLQKHLDELSILNKMSIALSSGQDLYHLLRLLLEEMKKLFVMDEFYIGIYNPEMEMVTFLIYFKDDEFIEISPRNLREQPGLTGAVIFSEKTLYIPDQADPEIIKQYKPLDAGVRRNRSYIGIPLLLNNTVIGILSVQSAQPNAYTSHQIQLLETIAAQSSIAIEKARLFLELQKELEQKEKLIAELELKNAETETLRESAYIVTATLEKSEAVDLILQQLKRVIPYDSASVQLIDDDELEIVSSRGLDDDIKNANWRFKINEDEPAYPILSKKVDYILYDDVQISVPSFNAIPHNNIHAWMAVPLKVKDKVFGLIALDGKKTGQFTERHAQLAVTYANQVAIVLENADLFTELQVELEKQKNLIIELETKNAESETLHESLASVVGTFEFSEIIQRVLDQIRRVIPYDSASVWRVEENRQKLIGGKDLPLEVMQPDFEIPIKYERNSALPVFRGDVPYIVYNNVQHERADFRDAPHNYINSWMAVPLKTKGSIIGVICLEANRRINSQTITLNWH